MNGVLAAKKLYRTRLPRQRKRLVCGGTIVSRAFSRPASCSDGWKAAANPSRFAVQVALTTRLCAKLSHGQNSQSSRLFRLPRTFDANRQPTYTTSHTTRVDLIQLNPREHKEENRATELKYVIESIISQSPRKGEKYPLQSQVGKLH